MKTQRHLMLVVVALVAIPILTGCDRPCEECRETPMTTVLLVRHAERGNDHLTDAGLARATKLAHVARKAGVTAIYATQFVRTQQTAQPLADELGLTTSIYESTTPDQISLFAAQVQSDHYGEVLLIVGHSNTVPMIVDALGGVGSSCDVGAEFDNLCIVTVYRPGEAKVVNLQYGEPSP